MTREPGNDTDFLSQGMTREPGNDADFLSLE
jgi:hypothetical protein